MNIPKPILAAIVASILVACAAVLIVIMPVRGGGSVGFDEFAVGFLIGSLFAQAVLASAWCALGPGPIYLRAPLSVLWCAVMWLALLCNTVLSSAPSGQVAPIMASCIAGIWITVQIPYWLLRAFGRMSLRLPGVSPFAKEEALPQYGIGQLLIFTSIIAVIFGVGRGVFALLPPMSEYFRGGEAGIFGALAVAAILISLPLPPAIFVQGWRALVATVTILVLIALATWWELPLFTQIMGASPGPRFMHFVWINVANAGWIAAFGLVVRLCGYRLSPRDRITA